jgi:hypothetical protein
MPSSGKQMASAAAVIQEVVVEAVSSIYFELQTPLKQAWPQLAPVQPQVDRVSPFSPPSLIIFTFA